MGGNERHFLFHDVVIKFCLVSPYILPCSQFVLLFISACIYIYHHACLFTVMYDVEEVF